VKKILLLIMLCGVSGWGFSQDKNCLTNDSSIYPELHIENIPNQIIASQLPTPCILPNDSAKVMLEVALDEMPYETENIIHKERESIRDKVPVGVEHDADPELDEINISGNSYFPRFVLIAYFRQLDVIFQDFDAFTQVLGESNVELLNRNRSVMSTGISGMFNRFYAGFSVGFYNDFTEIADSLNLDVTKSQFALHFGYNLVYSWRFIVTPMISVNWNRNRLLNSQYDRRISLEDHLLRRDLDIRFNQLTGFVGLRVGYKVYNPNPFGGGYWTVGGYVGYCFKINEKPWIYSHSSRLTTDHRIGVRDISFGISFSYNFSFY